MEVKSIDKKSFKYAAPVFLILCLLAGCSSGPPIIPEDLSVLQFFQRAQEQTDVNAWENALTYYETFISWYPDDLPNVAAARYEIAFIRYKQGDYEKALKDFQDLLNFYEESSLPLDFPMWPKVLAYKMSEIIKEKTNSSVPAPAPTEAE
jgi:outer membrane protein assembly factor BamD (BamD/ComL family)